VSKKFEITINKKKYTAKEGETILDVAKNNDLYIPTLCHHPDLEPNANCRICLVELKCDSSYKTVCACETEVFEGMEIKLDSPKVKKSRKLNLEMLFSDHAKKCTDCNWHDNCQLKKMSHDFGLTDSRFSQRRRKFKIDQKTHSMFWDSSKCIECGNCLSTCQNIAGLDNIDTKYTGSSIIFGPKGGKTFADTNCVYCGQCIIRCPSGSLQEKSEINEVLKILEKKNSKQILVAQFAPSTRYSIGELFRKNYGKNFEKKLITALKQLGFDYIFDVNFGADITTVEEAEELIEKIESRKDLPMFTSCCPAWVRYVEIFHHELLPNLTSTKSPNQCLGSAVKSYFAKKQKIHPKNIKIVSIMPCVAKKYESKLRDFRTSTGPDIDYVLTVRELARILKDKQIDLEKLEESFFDSLLGDASGAAAIYGSSGGVMESALRTVSAKLSDKDLKRIQFCEVRGLEGIKEASIEIDGRVLEVAVVSGLKNAAKLLKDMKSGIKSYDYIEVMACPGGCLGGGGQPIPTDPEVRCKRSAGFYTDDESKEIRRAHDNKDLQKMYAAIEAKPMSQVAEKLFHRGFVKRIKK
jgi:iron-only hydrogenase group A